MKTEIKSPILYATRQFHQMSRFEVLGRFDWKKFSKLRKDLIRWTCDEYGISAEELEKVIVDFDFMKPVEEFHNILAGLKK